MSYTETKKYNARLSPAEFRDALGSIPIFPKSGKITVKFCGSKLYNLSDPDQKSQFINECLAAEVLPFSRVLITLADGAKKVERTTKPIISPHRRQELEILSKRPFVGMTTYLGFGGNQAMRSYQNIVREIMTSNFENAGFVISEASLGLLRVTPAAKRPDIGLRFKVDANPSTLLYFDPRALNAAIYRSLIITLIDWFRSLKR